MLKFINVLNNQPGAKQRKDPNALLDRLHTLIFDIERQTPTLPFNELLVGAITRLAQETNLPITDSLAEPFGNSAGTWLPFPDSIDALIRLKRYYPTLAILSNIDNTSIRATVDQRLAPVTFEAVYTAQDIGSYKPAIRNFEYLAGHLRQDHGVDCDQGEVLHVAHSMFADHVPCKKLGWKSAWISRGKDEGSAHESVGGWHNVGYEWQFRTLGDFADEVERQFSGTVEQQ